MVESINKVNIGNISQKKLTFLRPAFGYAVDKPVENNYVYPVSAQYVPVSKLSDKQDKQLYNELSGILDKRGKEYLNILLKTGKLLDKNSNDGTSTLLNLYKIATEPRAQGLDRAKVLRETLKTLVKPFMITQNFGQIPDFMMPEVLSNARYNNLVKGIGLNTNLVDHFTKARLTGPASAITSDDVNVVSSGACVAASIEFNLADKKPAEFARYVAGLTSPDLSVKTRIKYTDISPKMSDAVSLLSQFNTEYKPLDWNTVDVTLRPDRNAIVRARVQNSYQTPGSRTLVDALMQATFMQLGSEASYDSLTDRRYGSFNPSEKGLTEFEKNFAESVVDGNGGKSSITYQNIDSKIFTAQNIDNQGNFTGYASKPEDTYKYLADAIDRNIQNLVIAVSDIDSNNKVTNMQEFGVLRGAVEADGNLYLICVDTNNNMVKLNARQIAPRISAVSNPHLAGYTNDFEATKKHLLDSLNTGSNIIIGITEVDNGGNLLGGHEITVIGSRVDSNGELYFICNDTDDGVSEPMEWKASELIPKIHHAGIPNKVLNLPSQPEQGYVLLNELQNARKQNPVRNQILSQAV